MSRLRSLVLALLVISTLVLSSCATEAMIQPAEPRTLTALVGAGQDTTAVSTFFPGTLRVRAGDTITWNQNTDEIHTVTFVGGDEELPSFIVPVPGGGPGELMLNPQAAFPTRMPEGPVETFSGMGFANSGIMSSQPMGPDAPPNDAFSLTFDTPGTFPYVCAIHPYMRGIVEVLPATAANVPSQEEIDSVAQAELEAMLAQVEAARAQASVSRGEPGPNDTTIWFAKAGGLNALSGDLRAEAFEFLPGDLTIKAGDTVVWTAGSIHTVTFIPAPPPPQDIIVQPQDQGPPLLLINPEVAGPVKPAGEYDPEQYYNSGIIGALSPAGASWALTFTEPGTYTYFCALHRMLGMEGTITVQAR